MPRKLTCQCGVCKVCYDRQWERDKRETKRCKCGECKKCTRGRKVDGKVMRDPLAFTGTLPKVRLTLTPLDVFGQRGSAL